MKDQPAITVERYIPECVGFKRKWVSKFGYKDRAEAERILAERIAHWRSRGWQPIHSRVVTIKVQL